MKTRQRLRQDRDAGEVEIEMQQGNRRGRDTGQTPVQPLAAPPLRQCLSVSGMRVFMRVCVFIG